MAKKKKTLADEMEEIDAMGQDDEVKAAKWVIEKGEEDRHEESEKSAEAEWKLHDKRRNFFTYKDLLLAEFRRQMVDSYQLLPKGFAWYPVGTTKGIVLWVKDLENRWYAKGITVSGIPKYDLNGVERLIDKALDFMEESERKYVEAKEAKKPKEKKSKGGILLP